ncbi:MAG: hypothetical protein SVX28_09975, partial [Pseudomonadota bacterium]|nr:hypothetical protein [Pseudomonadota bacterium]
CTSRAPLRQCWVGTCCGLGGARHTAAVGQWQGALSIQMVEYLFDHRGILNRGNDPDGTFLKSRAQWSAEVRK